MIKNCFIQVDSKQGWHEKTIGLNQWRFGAFGFFGFDVIHPEVASLAMPSEGKNPKTQKTIGFFLKKTMVLGVFC